MDKLFLLDAYALIYRSYYAFIKNPRINSKGQNTSAIIGFCNTLNEVLQKEQPSHIGVAFDPHGPTFRSEAFPAYKAQRDATPEDIHKAVPIIKDILRAYHIPILQVEGYEGYYVEGGDNYKPLQKANIGVAIGYKDIRVNGKIYRLFVFGARGDGYEEEWAVNSRTTRIIPFSELRTARAICVIRAQSASTPRPTWPTT